MDEITEGKRAEEALRESEARYRTLVQYSPLGIATARLDDLRIVQSNPALCQLLGYTEEELTGMTVTEITHPGDREADIRARHAVLAGSAVRPPHEKRLIRKDGSEIEVFVTSARLPDAPGRPGMVLGIVEDITERRREEEALRDSRTQLRALAARLAEAEEGERRRLARELHDQVGQNLAVLSLNLERVRAQLFTSQQPGLASNLTDSINLIEQTVSRIRAVMADLRPPALDDFGLLAALRWYGERFAERTGVSVAVEGTDPGVRSVSEIETALFRISQEALTNVAKHAAASHVLIQLTTAERGIRLTIADDGRGFDAPTAPGPRWGLAIMRERALAVGAEFRVESAPGRGTRIVVEAGA